MNVLRKPLNAAIVIKQRCRTDGLAKKPTGSLRKMQPKRARPRS